MNEEYLGPDEVIYQRPEDYLWITIMGACGCGTGVAPYRAVEILENFKKEYTDKTRFDVYDNLADEVIAHWLDKVGLLDHGGSIGGSWITDKGKEVLAEIEGMECQESGGVI